MSQVNIQNETLGGQASIGKKSASVKEVFAAYGALFASVATLFCCALPALLVLLGFGLTSVLSSRQFQAGKRLVSTRSRFS